MQCPVDGTTLAISDKQGIEIDYCPQCRGIWLDRGELEKLLDRMGSEPSSRPRDEYRERDDDRPRESHDRDREEYRHDDHDDHDNRHGGHKKKREGFLGDLFDF